MAEVALNNISKAFGAVEAVSGLSLTIASGECVVLLGPTGAGKTTTLRLVAGLEKCDAGSVHIEGANVTREPPACRDVAFVFQQYSLYPHLSVFDNLAFPLRAPSRRYKKHALEARVQSVAELLGLGDKLKNKATELSGGQMQRVALGRALVREPSIYLMDEPLSSLDAKLRSDLRVELKHIQEALGTTMLYVTHDNTEAMTLGDRIGVLNKGRLVQLGAPREIYDHPADTYVAARLGIPVINLLSRSLFSHISAPPDAAIVGARTEHLRIRKARNGNAAGVVNWIEHLGDHNQLHIKAGAETLVTLMDPDAGIAQGDDVEIELVNPLFFDKNGTRVAA
jgi:multiple sugar transport system ATP-binding protein